MNRDHLIVLAGKIIDGTASDIEIERFNLFITYFQPEEDNEEGIVLDEVMEEELLKKIHAGLYPVDEQTTENTAHIQAATTDSVTN